jgi:cytoskeleton protein RodZ
VGFIRAYADHLGLDSIEIVCRFKDEVEGVNERLQLVFPTPAPESKIPSGAVLLISVLLIALAYGGWYYLSSGQEDGDGRILAVPDRLEPLASGPETQALSGPVASAGSILTPAEPGRAGPGTAATAPRGRERAAGPAGAAGTGKSRQSWRCRVGGVSGRAGRRSRFGRSPVAAALARTRDFAGAGRGGCP